MSVIELIVSLVVILGAAIVFTNAVEILGERLNLGQGAVGSILAAVGTALPETMIPIVAILGALILGGNTSSASDIGIGAILGAPFLLATLAMFVVGVSAIGFRQRRQTGHELSIDESVVKRDIGFFFVFFALAAVAGLVALPLYVKIILGVVLIGAYVAHVLQTLRGGGEAQSETPQNLLLWPGRSQGPTWAAAAQVIGSVAVMAAGAHFFVQAVEHISGSLGIPAGLIALVLAPLATELPEKFNSVIWLRENKDTLAFGNITGAMVFQSTIPVSIGVLLTPWNLGFLNGFAVALALLSGAVLFVILRSKKPLRAAYLLGGGVLYAAFVVAAVVAVFL